MYCYAKQPTFAQLSDTQTLDGRPEWLGAGQPTRAARAPQTVQLQKFSLPEIVL